MKNIAFCTITYGEEYVRLGDTLIKQINDLGYHIFVMTNDVGHYDQYNENLTVIEYKKSYFSFHEKKEVAKECLKHYDAAFFLDADVVIKDTNDISIFDNINAGLHIFSTFGNLYNTFFNNDIAYCEAIGNRNTKYGERGRELIENLGLEYKRDYHGVGTTDYLEHYLEGRWIIKKDNGLENKFFEIWDSIADFCEEEDIRLGFVDSVGAGEGAAMSIAAFNSKINITFPSCVWFVTAHFISNYHEKVDGTIPWDMVG